MCRFLIVEKCIDFQELESTSVHTSVDTQQWAQPVTAGVENRIGLESFVI